MEKRKTKLIAFGLSIGQSVLGLVATFLLLRFEGASPAFGLYVQASAFTLTMTAILGIEASRHQMVHWRLNRAPDEARTMIRSLFSLLMISRSILALLFLFAPSLLLSWLTNADVGVIDAERGLLRILGFEQIGQLLLDLALFAGITRGWRISAPATAFAIYFLRVVALWLWRDSALEASLYGIVVGEFLGAGYLLWRMFGREEFTLTKPKLSARAFAAGMRIALPTSLLGFFPAFLLWGRNYLLFDIADPRMVALFGFIQPLLATIGMVFAITLNTSEGILVSDRGRPLQERRQMVLSGFVSGLTWALGTTLIVAALAPWIVRVVLGFFGNKFGPQDFLPLSEILRWMSALIGGATLHAFAVKVAMGLAQNKRFFAINAIALGLGAVVMLGFARDEWAVPVVALVSGTVSLVASVVFFLRVGAWSPKELARRMSRPLVALALIAMLALGVFESGLDRQFAASRWFDATALGIVGFALLGVYLLVAWGPSLRRRSGERVSLAPPDKSC